MGGKLVSDFLDANVSDKYYEEIKPLTALIHKDIKKKSKGNRTFKKKEMTGQWDYVSNDEDMTLSITLTDKEEVHFTATVLFVETMSNEEQVSAEMTFKSHIGKWSMRGRYLYIDIEQENVECTSNRIDIYVGIGEFKDRYRPKILKKINTNSTEE